MQASIAAELAPHLQSSHGRSIRVVSPDAFLWLSVAGAVVSCFAAIGARALRDFSRSDLQDLCERRQHPDRFSDIVRHHDRVALSVECVEVSAITLSVTAGSLGTWAHLAVWVPNNAAALL